MDMGRPYGIDPTNDQSDMSLNGDLSLLKDVYKTYKNWFCIRFDGCSFSTLDRTL